MKLHAASTSSSLLWIPPNTLPTTAAGFELVLTVRSLAVLEAGTPPQVVHAVSARRRVRGLASQLVASIRGGPSPAQSAPCSLQCSERHRSTAGHATAQRGESTREQPAQKRCIFAGTRRSVSRISKLNLHSASWDPDGDTSLPLLYSWRCDFHNKVYEVRTAPLPSPPSPPLPS